MDGTLTVACHDFDLIRSELGLPKDQPILEEIAKLPSAKANLATQQLYQMEMDLAAQAKAQPGIETLLESLTNGRHKLGIVTRNSLEIAHATLKACGLSDYFLPENMFGRECCEPKPSPQAVLKLMQMWSANRQHTALVGDHWFDLKSGFDAGVLTVHFSVDYKQTWPDVTDLRFSSFRQITDLIAN